MDWRSWEHRQLSLVGVAMQGWGLPTLSGLPPAEGKELARRLGIFHFEGNRTPSAGPGYSGPFGAGRNQGGDVTRSQELGPGARLTLQGSVSGNTPWPLQALAMLPEKWGECCRPHGWMEPSHVGPQLQLPS